ncbi:MAG TPA: DHA2 family efflux MFS transporter permease subunit [Oculatellaceae cyanobacterium]
MTESNVHVPLKNWIAVFGSAIGAFMAVLDIQITSSSLRDIQGALGASVDEGSWISTAYLIAEIITIPLTGWLAQVFSPKLYVVFNATLFVLFSVVCGMAHDLPTMIACRAAQGFTGGILIPTCFSTILQMLPPPKIPIGMAIFAITATFAPSIGPAIGGYLTDALGWQYIFYLNIVPGVVLILMLLYSLPTSKPKLELLKRNDLPGIIFMAVGLSNLIYVLEEGQRKDWLGSDLIQRSAVLAVVFLVAFIVRELTAKFPLVNIRLLLRRNFGLGSIANVALGVALYGSVFLQPLYLSVTQGYSAWQIGQYMIWSGLPQLVIIPFVPMLMRKTDPRFLLCFGLAAFGSSCLLNAFMSHDYAGPQLITSMLVRAIGQPFIMVPLSAMATAGIEKEQVGSASALFNMMRNLGGSVGTAVASTLVTQREQFHSVRLNEHITDYDLAVRNFITDATARLHHAGATLAVAHDQAVGVLASKIRNEAYVMAFNDAFASVAVVLFIAVIAAMLLQKPQGQMHAAAE